MHFSSGQFGALKISQAILATHIPHLPYLTVLVNGEGHIRGDDLIAANLTELEGTVSIHCLHLQDAVVCFALDDCSLIGLLLEHG